MSWLLTIKSLGHLRFGCGSDCVVKYEYFLRDGIVYRAEVHQYVGRSGYRLGAKPLSECVNRYPEDERWGE